MIAATSRNLIKQITDTARMDEEEDVARRAPAPCEYFRSAIDPQLGQSFEIGKLALALLSCARRR
ncbi:hypothetical protein ACSSNL_04080 [Thalassobius sp. S69A]|uniref:hypothetical protein n=1 Tax=unclassified Thalassovita TaxID=2619711 RepID=UPI003C7ED145